MSSLIKHPHHAQAEAKILYSPRRALNEHSALKKPAELTLVTTKKVPSSKLLSPRLITDEQRQRTVKKPSFSGRVEPTNAPLTKSRMFSDVSPDRTNASGPSSLMKSLN